MPELFTTKIYGYSSLVSYWRLEGNSTDTKGLNSGTDTSITYAHAHGVYGQGASFNGSSSKIVIPNASINGLKITGSQTWGSWVQIANNTGTHTIMGRSNAGASQLLRLAVNPTGGTDSRAYFQLTGLTTTSAATVTNLSINIWYFVVGTYDGASIKVYLNGNLESIVASTGTVDNPTSQFGIGILGDYSGFQYMNGKIDDPFVCNAALTDSDVQTLWRTAINTNKLRPAPFKPFSGSRR